MSAHLEGMETVKRNLNAEIAGIKGRSMAGLLAAGLMVEGESNRNVPREYGNLAGSSFTQKAPDGAEAVEAGYQAAYAPFVHENTEQKLKGKPRPSGLGTYWNPGGPKFLENAVRNLRAKIVSTIASYAKVK